MDQNRVIEVTCGILYNHSFKLLDNWGAIADDILYNTKTPFDANYFPNVGGQYPVSCSLGNTELGHSLQLSSSNLVYKHVIQSNYQKEFAEFSYRISKYLVPEIIEANKLVVKRIGVVFACAIPDEGIQAFAQKYFRPEIHNIANFRFSKKESATSGAIWSDKSDFINKIYTVGSIGDNLAGISFDYQAHYMPPRLYISNVVKSVLDQGQKQLFNEILSVGEDNGKK